MTTHHWRKFKNVAMQAITFACALLVILPLALVFYHVVKSGIGAVNWDFFTKLPKPVGEAGGGMVNAIVGTFALLGLAAFIGVPVGVPVGAAADQAQLESIVQDVPAATAHRYAQLARCIIQNTFRTAGVT